MRAFIDPRPILLLVMFWFISCTLPAGAKPVWLVSNGFHTSFALRTADSPSLAALAGDPAATDLLIGWGHRAFYQRRINPCTTLSAVLWINSSTLHVIPIRGPVTRRFPHSDVIRLSLSPAQYRCLATQLERAFARDCHGRAIVISRGYFQNSRFYAGRETFWLGQMCNAWVGRKLRRSGVPIVGDRSVFASSLVMQAGPLGKREQYRKRPSDAF